MTSAKIPSPKPTTTPAGIAKGAPAKKAGKVPSLTPTTNPMGVTKAAPAKKSAKAPVGKLTTPAGQNKGK